MNVKETIKVRKSTRAFLNKPVKKEKVTRILDVVRFAPSGVNTQPWSVAVVSGEKKQSFQNKMEALFRLVRNPIWIMLITPVNGFRFLENLVMNAVC